MNINELFEQVKANSGLTGWQCNVRADSILELIAAYREAVAALDINTKLFDQYDSCHKLSITEPARKRARDALATAKHLGVE